MEHLELIETWTGSVAVVPQDFVTVFIVGVVLSGLALLILPVMFIIFGIKRPVLIGGGGAALLLVTVMVASAWQMNTAKDNPVPASINVYDVPIEKVRGIDVWTNKTETINGQEMVTAELSIIVTSADNYPGQVVEPLWVLIPHDINVDLLESEYVLLAAEHTTPHLVPLTEADDSMANLLVAAYGKVIGHVEELQKAGE